MTIDSLSYFGFWPYWDAGPTALEDLMRLQEEKGIAHSILCSTKAIFYDHVQGNRDVTDAVTKYPRRFSTWATFHPRAESFSKEITESVRGIRLYPAYHGYRLRSKAVSEVLDYASAHQLPVSIPIRLIMSFALPELQAEEIMLLAEKHAKVKVIISCANYEVFQILDALDDSVELYVDTLGLRVDGLLERLVDTIGAEHIVLATGLPVQYPDVSLDIVRNANIREEEKTMILYENGKRLFRL